MGFVFPRNPIAAEAATRVGRQELRVGANSFAIVHPDDLKNQSRLKPLLQGHDRSIACLSVCFRGHSVFHAFHNSHCIVGLYLQERIHSRSGFADIPDPIAAEAATRVGRQELHVGANSFAIVHPDDLKIQSRLKPLLQGHDRSIACLSVCFRGHSVFHAFHNSHCIVGLYL